MCFREGIMNDKGNGWGDWPRFILNWGWDGDVRCRKQVTGRPSG